MTVTRGAVVLAFFGWLAVMVVGIRSEQAMLAARIEKDVRERVVLRRESWALQMEISRLRTPDRIEDRVVQWSLDIAPPRPPSEVFSPMELMAAR
jgi:hypothetical protein